MTLLQQFFAGGPFMFAIFGFGVLTIAMIIERTIALYFKLKTPSEDFRQQVVKYVETGDFKGAAALAEGQASSTSLGRVVATGCYLKANGGGEEELQARMDEVLAKEISSIDKRTGFLAMFGNVSTLLGLLGTISGMISAFAAVASANPADRAILLSQGISEALNSTAFGLIVAIPALVAYAIFQNRTDRVVTELTESTSQIFHDLLFLTDGRGSATTAPRTSGVTGLNPQPVGA